ncbi:MAG: flippase [Epsilonproteobacteria bacterium]|nr:flippase [Campylobacterota bacterium]
MPNSKQRLLANIFSLSTLQIFNYILPLITLPYLVRVLGVEQFGLLAFAMSLVLYFGVLMDYGFNLSAARSVSLHRDEREKLCEILGAVYTSKLILMLLGFMIFGALLLAVERFWEYRFIYLASFAVVAAQTLFPVWFFQGIERLKFVTLISVGSKTLFTCLLFVLVQTPADAIWVPLLNAFGFALCAAVSLYIITRKMGIALRPVSLQTLKTHLQDSHAIFVSNVAISLYTVSTTFILGLFTNNTVVGYYAAADRIIQAFKSLLMPLSQSIYPHISHKLKSSQEEALHFIRKSAKYLTLALGGLSLFISIAAPWLVRILLGDGYEASVILVQIMSPLPLIIGLSNLFGIQTMVNFGKKEAFKKILWSAAMIGIALSFILVPLFAEIGSAIGVLITEIFVTLMMFLYLQKNGLEIVKR